MSGEAAGAVDPDLRERIDRALAPYRKEALTPGLFFEVDIRLLSREDLYALLLWIADNSRNKRLDA